MATNNKDNSGKKPLPEREFVQVNSNGNKPAATSGSKPASTGGKKAAPAEKAPEQNQPQSSKSAFGLRMGAVIAWVLAAASTVGTIIMLMEGNLTLLLVFLVLAAVLCIVGAQLWKRANRRSPKFFNNKFITWCWNNMGVVVAFVLFLPIGLFLIFKSEKLDKRGKTIASVVAVIMVLIVGLFSYEYEAPVRPTEEHTTAEQLEAEQAAGNLEIPDNLTGDLDDTAYWTRYGNSYHFDPDCFTIRRSLTVYQGTLADAIQAKKYDACDYCAQGHDQKDNAAAADDPDSTAQDTDTVDSDVDSGIAAAIRVIDFDPFKGRQSLVA